MNLDSFATSHEGIWIGGPFAEVAQMTFTRTLRRSREVLPLPITQLAVHRRGRWVIVTGFVGSLDEPVYGAARCSDRDAFSWQTGIQIAANRAAKAVIDGQLRSRQERAQQALRTKLHRAGVAYRIAPNPWKGLRRT